MICSRMIIWAVRARTIRDLFLLRIPSHALSAHLSLHQGAAILIGDLLDVDGPATVKLFSRDGKPNGATVELFAEPLGSKHSHERDGGAGSEGEESAGSDVWV